MVKQVGDLQVVQQVVDGQHVQDPSVDPGVEEQVLKIKLETLKWFWTMQGRLTDHRHR